MLGLSLFQGCSLDCKYPLCQHNGFSKLAFEASCFFGLLKGFLVYSFGLLQDLFFFIAIAQAGQNIVGHIFGSQKLSVFS